MDYQSEALITLEALISGGAISPLEMVYGISCKTDSKRAAEILRQLEEPKQRIALPSDYFFLVRNVAAVYASVVRDLQQIGIIPQAIATEIASFLDTSCIELNETNLTHYFQPDRKSQSSKSKLVLSSIVFRFYADELSTILNGSLSHQDIMLIALQQGIAHEYGHAVNEALARLLAGRTNDTIDSAYAVIAEDVYWNIAPRQELLELFLEPDNELVARYLTSIERISNGFEYIGLRAAIAKYGVGNPDDVVGKSLEQWLERSREHGLFIKEKRRQGLTHTDLEFSLLRLDTDLEEDGEFHLAKKLKQKTASFATINFGYAYPLSQQETKNLISKYAGR